MCRGVCVCMCRGGGGTVAATECSWRLRGVVGAELCDGASHRE